MGHSLLQTSISKMISSQTATIEWFLNEASESALPIEVCEHIINMVAQLADRWDNEELQGRYRTLRACSLVARSWIHRSRLHLFRDVILSSDLRTKEFLNVLSHSPELLRYVEILRILPVSVKDGVSLGWIYQVLSTLPPFLPRLRELSLCGLPVLHPIWIVTASRFSTIETLSLYRLRRQPLREIVQLINRFPRLQSLNVLDCSWKLSSTYYGRKQHNLTTLHTFTNIPEWVAILEWALASGSTGTLTTFRAPSGAQGLAMDSILKTCYSTLQELHLNIWSDYSEYDVNIVCRTACSLVAIEIPLLTNHLALQRLALYGKLDMVIPMLPNLPLFAPSSLVSIGIGVFHALELRAAIENPEAKWKDTASAIPSFLISHFSNS